MNREDIIKLAREAGGLPDPMVFIGAYERFAALVAAAEREACAKESLDVLDRLREEAIAKCQQGMVEAYKLGQSEEREECAKVCESYIAEGIGTEMAEAIRARGQA